MSSIVMLASFLMIIEILLAMRIGNLVYQYQIEKEKKKNIKNKQGKEVKRNA